MDGSWTRFYKLSGREQRDFLLGLLLLPAVVAWLRLFDFRSAQRTLEKWCGDAVSTDQGDNAAMFAEAQSTTRMVDAASRRGIVHGNCLSRSMVLWWLLRRRSLPAHLRIGARKTGDGFEAHAWVEMVNRTINDADDVQERYTPFEGPVTGKMVAQK